MINFIFLVFPARVWHVNWLAHTSSSTTSQQIIKMSNQPKGLSLRTNGSSVEKRVSQDTVQPQITKLQIHWQLQCHSWAMSLSTFTRENKSCRKKKEKKSIILIPCYCKLNRFKCFFSLLCFKTFCMFPSLIMQDATNELLIFAGLDLNCPSNNITEHVFF